MARNLPTLTTGLHPPIEEKAFQPGNTPTSSISETGWKPILGFQPVFVRTSERCFQLSAVSPNFKLEAATFAGVSASCAPSTPLRTATDAPTRG